MKKYLLILSLLIAPVLTCANENILNVLEEKSEMSFTTIANELNISPTIVGNDDREKMTSENAKNLEKAVVVVVSIDPDNGISFCSGAMVGPNVVLTAAHCFTNDNSQYRKYIEVFAILSPYTINYDKTHLPISGVATKLKASDKYLECIKNFKSPRTMAAYDYGIIVLHRPIGLYTGWFDLKNISMLKLKSSKIELMGLSSDKELNTLWKSEGNVNAARIINDNTFTHNADMLQGASGGPIVLKNNPNEIIGINVAQFGDDYSEDGYPNLGLKVTKDMVDLVYSGNREAGPFLTAK